MLSLWCCWPICWSRLPRLCDGASLMLPAPTFHSLLDVAANLKIKFIIWDWPSWQRTVASFVSFVLFPALLSFLSYLHIIFTIYKYTTCLQVLEFVLVVSASAPTVVTLVCDLYHSVSTNITQATQELLADFAVNQVVPLLATSQLLENVSVLCKFWTFVKRNKTKLKFRQHITKCIHKSICFLCVLSNIFPQVIVLYLGRHYLEDFTSSTSILVCLLAGCLFIWLVSEVVKLIISLSDR